MNPFYDLNKRLTGIGAEQKQQLSESKPVAAKSPVQLSLEQSLGQDLRSLMEDGTGGMVGSNTLEAKDKSLSKAAKTVKKGALHKQEGIPQDKKIGDKKLQSLKKSGTPLEKKRANFALNIQGKGKKKVDEADRGFSGVGGARDREDDERHDLDPSDWYIVIDGKLMKASVYPNQHAQARAEGFCRTKEEARAKAGQQGMGESHHHSHQQSGMTLNGHPIDRSSIELGGVDTRDYPDFADAYIEYAEFADGTPLTDDEIDQLNDEQYHEINQLAHDSLYENKDECVECAMGECDMHGEQPKDMNPRNKDWDDAAIARLRAQKNQRTAKRRVGQRDTGQPPVMTDLDETHGYNELKDIYMWTERHGMPSWKLVARNVLGQSVGHAIDRLCGKHFDTDPDDYEVVASGSKPKPLDESEDDILSYLKDKIAPANPKSRATSRPYNGRSGAADAHNGMEFEGSMFPGSDEYDSKFGKPTADLDSAFSRGSSPAGGTVYTRKRKEVPFDSDEVEKPVASSDGPRKRGRPAGSKGGGGARLAGTHVPKHARSKEMDEGRGECPHCGQSMPGHGQGREIDLEAVKQGMGHFVNNVAPAARKAAGIAKVVGGAKSKVDYDGDGKKESGKAEHAGSVDKAIKANKSKSPAKPAAPAKGSDKPAKKAKEGDKPAKKTEEGKGDGNLANNAKPYDKVTRGDVVAGRLGKDEEGGKKKDKKEKKVEETTTSGSVAPAAGGKSSGGMSVGKGIYDSWNRKYNTMLSESINITTNSVKGDDGEEDETITIDVSGDDVARIKELLHSMGVGGDDGAEHMHGSQGMPSDFIEIDEAEAETPKPSAPVPPGPNGPWPAGSPQAQAYSKMSPEDQKFLGHANPLDPLILARAPNGGKPVAANAGNGLSPEYQGKPAAPAAAAPAAAAPAAAAAKPAAPAAAGGLLALGSKGPEVKALQKLLGMQNQDGDFGPQTRAAVIAKQKELNVDQDGVWGPQSKAAMSAQAGRVNGQNVSPEQQGRPAPTPPAAISQADKIAKFKALLAKARERAAPNPTDAGNGRSPETQGGPVNPATAPVTGVPESMSYFLNKMRLLEDLTDAEKKEIEALYKELGNTEQPDPELSSLLNQYNGLFPTGSTASSGADQAGASADAADADTGAAMQAGANRAAFNQSVQDTENAYNDTSNAAIRSVQDTEDAYNDTSNAAIRSVQDTEQGLPTQPTDPSGNFINSPKDIPANADTTVPYWIGGQRYEFKRTATDLTPAWRKSNLGFINLKPGEAENAKKLTKQKFTGSQAEAPTSESIQRNSENQRLRELAGIAEAVAPVTKNAPDYPTNQVKADTQMMTQNLSGGLNGAKTTGQTTTPVVASQVKRLHSHVSEGQRMVDLYKTISAIENKEG